LADAKKFRVGVVGYSGKPFNKDIAKALLLIAFKVLGAEDKDKGEVVVVSGLTNLGIPALAYQIAKERGWQTWGIACKKAAEYEKFPCDQEALIGEDWGEESVHFLNNIDVLVRVGGGEQSMKEAKMAKEKHLPVYEYDLPITKEKS